MLTRSSLVYYTIRNWLRGVVFCQSLLVLGRLAALVFKDARGWRRAHKRPGLAADFFGGAELLGAFAGHGGIMNWRKRMGIEPIVPLRREGPAALKAGPVTRPVSLPSGIIPCVLGNPSAAEEVW